MKLIKLLFIIFPLLIFSQNPVLENQLKHVYHYDKDFKQTDSISSYYYKEVLTESNFIPSGPIVCYTKNGVIVSKTYASYFKPKFGEIDSIIKNGPLTTFFPNKKKSSIGFYINNIQIGDKFNYNENGVLISEVTFLDGELSGFEKKYYKTGELKSEKFNVNGIYEGVETGYFKSGEKKYLRYYSKGLLEGEEIAFHKNGNTFYKRNYSSGSIIGDEKGYSSTGKLIYKKKYKKFNKKKIIENLANPFSKSDSLIPNEIPKSLERIIFYYDSGEINQELNYLNGSIEGKCIGYYKNGATSYIFNFVLGEKEGISETYFKNGDVKSSCNFKSGFKDGEEIVYNQSKFYEDGSPYFINYKTIVRSYNNGVLNGLETGYYDNSSKSYTQIWENGLLNGVKVVHYIGGFQETGVPKEEYNFLDGVKHGDFSTFYETGELEITGKYTNGVREKIIKRYYKSGNLKAEEYYNEGSKEGKWIEYYESGKIMSSKNYELDKLKGEFFRYDITNSEIIYSINYIDNLKHGLETNFFASCQPKIEINYNNGKKDGEEIEYYESGEIKSKLMYNNNEISGSKTSFYQNSGKIKEITEFIDSRFESITTGFYNSPNSEKKYVKLFDKVFRRLKTTKYYISGNLEYDEFFEKISMGEDAEGDNNIKIVKNKTFFHDLIKKIPSFKRRFSKGYYYGVGFDIIGNKVSEVKYFSEDEVKEKVKGEDQFYENYRTEYYPSMNVAKSIILDLDENGTETGYQDVESMSKLYEVNIVNGQKQGLMQYFKYNGIDLDYTENYVDNIRVDRKLALVIGNSEYKTFPILKNPVNDAKLLSKSLKKLGFKVIELYNIKTRYGMFDAIDEFKIRRKDSEINLIYFAGHGISLKGKNYLIPTDEVIETSKHLERSGFSAELLIRDLEFSKPGQRNIVILDACRNNPLKSTRGTGSGGLTDFEQPPKGTLIAFSTSYGAIANDGDGENSLYTKILAEKILEENISISGVFSNVRLVFDKMGVNQQPIEQSTLTGEVFLNGKN